MSLTIVAGILFGLTAVLFTKAAHGMQVLFRRMIAWPVARPVVGGLLVIGLVQLFDLSDYLGLGVSSSDPNAVTIVSSFRNGGAETWSWWWKIVLTAVTLGSGFKGGEVTPLFFVGAALGNTFAVQMGAPVDLFAALGFVSVFAGATNTPLACMIMSVELFGGEYLIYFAVSCLVAYLFSGHSGIYPAQRTGVAKPGAAV
jgi:H+/Cl- antiporter ClcA